ncbi:MAG TPA: hypothetical protein VIU61_28295 [Kofleriaceae bacterium]
MRPRENTVLLTMNVPADSWPSLVIRSSMTVLSMHASALFTSVR